MKWLLMILMFSMCVYAQDPAVAPSAAPAAPVIAQSGGEKAVAALKDVDSKIPVSIPAWILGSVAAVAEVGLRLYPSAKPKSLLLLIALGFSLIGSIFSKASGLLDSIAQNVKDPTPSA
jgi:hypothetical protein